MSADAPAWYISFTGAQQTLSAFRPMLHGSIDVEHRVKSLLAAVVSNREGNRPNRIKPRVRKRRPKNFPLMREPRKVYQNRMLKRG